MVWPFRRIESLGQRGEILARRFLKKAGMKILGQNYRCPAGEIDLIALDRSTRRTAGAETIVFVEVKTRSSAGRASPESAVNAHKQDQIRRTAAYYLRHYPAEGYHTRFDVVAIILPENEKPRINHISDAF